MGNCTPKSSGSDERSSKPHFSNGYGKTKGDQKEGTIWQNSVTIPTSGRAFSNNIKSNLPFLPNFSIRGKIYLTTQMIRVTPRALSDARQHGKATEVNAAIWLNCGHSFYRYLLAQWIRTCGERLPIRVGLIDHGLDHYLIHHAFAMLATICTMFATYVTSRRDKPFWRE